MSNLRDAAQRAIEVMANARDFIGEEHYKAPTKEWNSEQQADELQEALLVLRAALAEVLPDDMTEGELAAYRAGWQKRSLNDPQRKPLSEGELDRQWTDEWSGFVSFAEAEVIVRWTEQRHGITGGSDE